jgi:Co/Zn/Cd efflux system component
MLSGAFVKEMPGDMPNKWENQQLINELKTIPGVLAVHTLRLWKDENGGKRMTVRLIVNGCQDDYTLHGCALEIVKRHDFEHATFEVKVYAGGSRRKSSMT